MICLPENISYFLVDVFIQFAGQMGIPCGMFILFPRIIRYSSLVTFPLHIHTKYTHTWYIYTCPPNSHIHIFQSSSTFLDAIFSLSLSAVYYLIHKEFFFTSTLSCVSYRLALAFGTCHLPLQRVKYELLQMMTSTSP